jgi:tRNA threonylcarbamoyl adenosine modification protein (Sua5/YciO/YrdC/YwlC family)
VTGDPAAIRATVAAVAAGGLVVFPTETVYGIACRADRSEATERLFSAKRRARGLALPVMAATVGEALALTDADAVATALAGAFWPGPLTIVVARNARCAGWALGEHPDTIALRVPAHPFPAAVLALSGPLAVSSANVSGRLPAATGAELLEDFGDLVDVIVSQPEPTGQAADAASTVVDLTSGAPRVVRAGPIGEDALRSALARANAGEHWVD